MDEDDVYLINRLLLRAGMIMEDQSMLAITMPSTDERARTSALITLSGAAHTMSALVSAAIALDQYIER
jgi:hypothetical protein